MCEDRKTHSSVMFKPLMLPKNLSLMDLDSDGYLYMSIYVSAHVLPPFQHDHLLCCCAL